MYSHIIFVSDLSKGGSQRSALLHYSTLQGYDQRPLLIFSGEPEFVLAPEMHFIRVDVPTFLRFPPFKLFFFVFYIRTLFKRFPTIKCVYTYIEYASFASILSLKPVVVNIQNSFHSRYHPISRAIFLSLLRLWHVKSVRVNSLCEYRLFKQCLPAKSAYYPQVNRSFLPVQSYQQPSVKTPSPHNRQYILYFGRLDTNKNVSSLLRAFYASLAFRQYDLLIVGSGPQLNYLRGITVSLQIDPYVFFKGWSTTVDEYIRQAAFSVLPSLSEGNPTVLYESLLYSCPLICSNTSIEALQLLHNQHFPCGIVYDRLSEADLTSSIRSYLSSPFLLSKHRSNCLRSLSDYINTLPESYCVDKGL